MSRVYAAPGFVLAEGDGYNSNSPVVGYEQRTTSSNLSTTSADADYPVTNLANSATNLRWQSEVTDEVYVTATIDTTELIDYVGIAKHNFYTAQIAVSVEGLTTDAGSPQDWVELNAPVIPSDDGPLLFRFTAQSFYAIRVRMQEGTAAARIGALRVGKLLLLQRRIYVGHTPITLGVSSDILSGRSENGHYLGRLVTGQKNVTSVSMVNLTPDWVRDNLVPFIRSAVDEPFFFAWRPGDYPSEIGYAWLSNDPQPNNMRSNGMMQFSMEMTGIV